MNILLLLLKTGQTIISLSDQLPEEPRVHLKDPYEVGGKTKLTLSPWPPYTDEKDILLTSDNLLTVVEPQVKLRDEYLKKIGKTLEEVTPKEPDKMLLSEEENVPEYVNEDYEPLYVEE